MEENQRRQNRWPLVALLIVAVVGVIGGAFAYFTSTDTFQNVFGTKPYSVQVTENFESPDNWLPGTTTNKTVVTTNTGDVDVAVRVKLTPKWETTTGTQLPLNYDYVDAQNPGTHPAAVINYTTNEPGAAWTAEQTDGYYYYKTKLAPGASTTSLIQSVLFDQNSVEGDEKTHVCNYTLDDSNPGPATVIENSTLTLAQINAQLATVGNANYGKHVVSASCTTTYGGYAGAKYTLDIVVETVQYDSYTEAWTGAPTIS